jgi:signal transduction histidine kinase
VTLTIRAKSLLAAAAIFAILLAPTLYSVFVLREISGLASTLAQKDARASISAQRLRALFEDAGTAARLMRVDPDYRKGLERSVDQMKALLDRVREGADPPLVAACVLAARAVRLFSDRALAEPPDEAATESAAAAAREAVGRVGEVARGLAASRTAEAEALAKRAAQLTLASGVAGLLVAAAVGTALLRALSRPLKDLVAGTERIARGVFDEPIPVRAGDELGRLAGAFNRMAGSLGELDRLKAEFLAAASHGLRTPLACVKGYLASLGSGRQGSLPDEARRAVARAEEEVDRVIRFVDQLLDLGRLRSGRLPMSMREVPASAFFTSVGRSFDALASQKGIAYEIRVGSDLPARITADPDRLSEAVINLLGNAFKYTPSGGAVTLSVRNDGGWVRVEVADTGPGIPRDEVPRIFEKYYRGGGVTAEGAGLGLAISRGIVERHGGTIWAESDGSGGARFVFKVPVRPPQAKEAAMSRIRLRSAS